MKKYKVHYGYGNGAIVTTRNTYDGTITAITIEQVLKGGFNYVSITR